MFESSEYYISFTPSFNTCFMNLLAYFLYLFLTGMVTIRAGWFFYKHGGHYILFLLQGQQKLADTINKLLLTGYYLLNLGYMAIMIRFWKPVHTPAELLGSVAGMSGHIMLTLATIHFLNMTVIWWFARSNHFIHS